MIWLEKQQEPPALFQELQNTASTPKSLRREMMKAHRSHLHQPGQTELMVICRDVRRGLLAKSWVILFNMAFVKL